MQELLSGTKSCSGTKKDIPVSLQIGGKVSIKSVFDE